MRRAKQLAEQVSESAGTPLVKEIQEPKKLISTGSTMLNLACSDSASGGFMMGKMVNLIGDSSSGKSFIALTLLAEAANNDQFKDYMLIYDDVEAACEFDIKTLFGEKLVSRLVTPNSREDLQESATIQDFHANVNTAIQSGKPFIYILDSFDALTSDEEEKKLEEVMEARKNGKEVSGTYGMEKAKGSSQILRNIVRQIKNSDSLLIIISQTRDNISPMAFQKKTRSGGRALKFYASYEIWLAVEGSLKARDRMVGVEVKAKVSKNKVTGKLRDAQFQIYYNYGVDDIGGCVDFLVNEKVWGKSKNTIEATTIGLSGTRSSLVQQIEGAGKETEVRKLVEETWLAAEKELQNTRKPKYA